MHFIMEFVLNFINMGACKIGMYLSDSKMMLCKIKLLCLLCDTYNNLYKTACVIPSASMFAKLFTQDFALEDNYILVELT